MSQLFHHVTFSLAFRPFYLAAAGLSVIQIILWGAVYAGLLNPFGPFSASLTHAHEMLFGFTSAIAVGFLLTAARVWTAQQTLHGKGLAGLLTVWLLGRLVIGYDLGLAGWSIALVDLLFLPLAALAVALPIWQTRNRRNFAFPIILFALAGINGLTHLSILEIISIDSEAILRLALDLFAIIVVIIAGRIIPTFSANALPNAGIRSFALLERSTIFITISIVPLSLLEQGSQLFGSVLLGLAAVFHCIRLLSWKPWKVLGNPLLWVLYLGYGWIIISYALRALSTEAVDLVAEPTALHAFSVGTIGTMTLGMMCRTSRGHTGRPLSASKFEIALFVLVTFSALSRVALPVLFPALQLEGVILSAILWALAFGGFFLRFWPILTTPRLLTQ